MAKILLVEDEPDQTEMIKTRLKAKNHQVLTAPKARQGIRIALEKKPDLILMDMILPDMHGLEAIIKLKQIPATKEIPIIALTAFGSPDFVEACFRGGICAFIRKPYEAEELFENIENNIRVDERDRRTNLMQEGKQRLIRKNIRLKLALK